MLTNRLKLGPKRKETGIKPTKLTLACNERSDLENMENCPESDPVETTEIIKSTPNIQLCSPRLFAQQNNPITPFTYATNRPVPQSSRVGDLPSKHESNLSTSLELADCKAKLEEHQSKLHALSLENDSLRNRQKILEAELANCSKDYYQRQLSRLRSQCQNYQIENLTTNHRIQILTSEKVQIQASSKKRSDELKNYMKQLQKEKVTIIQLRNQLSEKERTFKIALEQTQKSNDFLSKNHMDFTEKYSKLENELKDKMKTIDSLTKHNEILSNRFKESDGFSLATRKKYEQQLAEKQSKIAVLSTEQRTVIKEHEEMVARLRSEISALKEEQASKSQQMNRISFDIKSEQENIQKSLKIERLSQDIKEITFNLDNKTKIIGNYEKTLKNYYSPEQYSNLQRKCKELEDKRLASAKHYQEKLYNLQKENEKYRFQRLKTPASTSFTQKQGCKSFNEILKRNLEEIAAFKQEIRLKSEENNEIKSEMLEIKLKEKRYMNEIEILTKRMESQEKNIKIELEVEQQNYINEIDSLKRKLHTIQTRLEYKISENKQKDDFIKSTIIGRSKPSDVPFIVNELKRIFLERDKLQMNSRDSLAHS